MLTMRKSLQQLHCSVIGLAVLVATSLGSTGILDGNVVQAQAKYTNAVVKVNLSERSDGSGSGVVVKVEKMSNKRNKYSIVTNEHVVYSGKKGTTGVKIEVILPNGKKRTYTDAKVADLPYERCSEKKQVLYGLKQKNEICYYDLALIELTTPDTLTVATFAKKIPKVGDKVRAVGYPASKKIGKNASEEVGGNVTVTPGKVTHMFLKNDVRFKRINKIGFDADIVKGMSGGGIFNEQGELVGFNSSLKLGELTGGFWDSIYDDPITGKSPALNLLKNYVNSSWGMSIRELYTWRKDLFPLGHTIAENSASPANQQTNKPANQQTSKPTTLKTTNTQTKTQKIYSSIVEIDVPKKGKISGVISERGGNTYVVHTVMDKTNLSTFAVRVWNGTKIATVTAKKQAQTLCENGVLYCLTTLTFTSKSNLVVAEIGDSVLPIGATFCIVRFETTQKNMQCNANKLKEKVGISGSNNYVIADIIGHILVLKTETKNMTGGAVFYQNKLVGVIAYKDKAIEIAKLW